MARNSADLSSPEIIKQFRRDFISFSTAARNELEGVNTDVHRILSWLEREQKSHWKAKLIKRREEALKAKREYKLAKYSTGPYKKDHPEDERQAMKKAIRRQEEAEEKLRTIDRWIRVIKKEAINELTPVDVLSSRIAAMTPKVIHTLDEMLDNLDRYMEFSGSSGTDSKTSKNGGN